MKKLVFLFLMLSCSVAHATSGFRLYPSSITVLGDMVLSGSAKYYGDGSGLYNVGLIAFKSDAFTGDGSATQFTLTAQPLADSLLVYKNGVKMSLTTDYTFSGQSFTMLTAPASGALLSAYYAVGVSTDMAVIAADGSPIGTMITLTSTVTPSGYLPMDGSWYSTTTYSALFNVIGYSQSTGTVTNLAYFQVKDMSGLFMRGLDTSKKLDSEFRVIGSTEVDKIQGHYHSATQNSAANVGSPYSGISVGNASANGEYFRGNILGAITDGTNGTPRIGPETRPSNMAVAYFIKYAMTGTASISISSMSMILATDNHWTGNQVFDQLTVNNAADGLPVGSFINYASTIAPAGYLYCDGTWYSTTTYSDLFNVMGYKFSNLPISSGPVFTCDFRGMFSRGVDEYKLRDSEYRVIGSTEADKMQGHRHNWGYAANSAGGGGNASGYSAGTFGAGYILDPTTDGTNGTPRTGPETRPMNVAVAVMVKYTIAPLVKIDPTSPIITSSNNWEGDNTFTGRVTVSSLTVTSDTISMRQGLVAPQILIASGTYVAQSSVTWTGIELSTGTYRLTFHLSWGGANGYLAATFNGVTSASYTSMLNTINQGGTYAAYSATVQPWQLLGGTPPAPIYSGGDVWGEYMITPRLHFYGVGINGSQTWYASSSIFVAAQMGGVWNISGQVVRAINFYASAGNFTGDIELYKVAY